MNDQGKIRMGIAGAVLVAVGCLTPLLVTVLAAVGVSSAMGWLDFVLVPLFLASAGIVTHTLLRRRRASAEAAAKSGV